MKKRRSIIQLVIIGAFLITAFIFSFVPMRFGQFTWTSFGSNIRLGLDLSGGVAAVYRAHLPEGADDTLENLMPGTIASLQGSLMSQGFTEATIQREGASNLRVSVPDIDDPSEILRILGEPAQIEFRFRNETIITGGDIVSAHAGMQLADHVVNLVFTPYGARAFANATQHIDEVIEIWTVMGQGDDAIETLISSPRISSHITTGQAVVTGMGTAERSNELAGQINAGRLPLLLERLEVTTVSATLGQDALRYGIIAGIIGILLVMGVLIYLYRMFGVAASLTLLIFTVSYIMIMAMFPWVQLTLPGIAGVLLAIGIAIDGNIIIIERIKDEYRNGKSIKSAAYYGYRRSVRPILDANITTIIAGIVLFIFGTGPVQGFAITLLLGIVLEAFASLVITRWMNSIFIGLNHKNPNLYNLKRGKGYEELTADQNSALVSSQIESEARLKKERKEKEEQERKDRLEGGAVNA
ncbi:MAG: protein translocase subunit SecD [Firmicutes bacterium]|nr:protein translocase subunit SecD [Bacillota bacterium]